MRRLAARAWVAPIALAAITPALAVLASGHTLSWRDTARLFAPLRGLVVGALRELRLPLWNPHEGLGMPLFAQLMHGVLHPVSVLAAWLAPGAGMDLLLVAHVALAAAGAALLARQLGITRPAAAVAGLGFAMSGYVLGMTSNLAFLAAAGTAPWAVAGLRWAAGGDVRRVALAGAGVAVLHFAGDPQWTAVAIALGLALAGVAGGARGVLRAAAGAGLGTAIAAVQLAPAWALLGQTARATVLDPAERNQWALSPWRLLELVSPGLFGGRPGPAHAPVFLWLGGATRHGETLPFLPSVHVGIVLLALAGVGAVTSAAGRVLAVAAALLVWAALGDVAGADALLRHVPVWNAFRYPEKLVGPLTLCLALLGALGCERIVAAPPGRRAARAALVAAAACAGLAVAAGLASRIDGLPSAAAARAGLAAARVQLGLGLVHPAVALAAFGALLHRAASGRALAAPRLATAAALLVALEAAAASPFALHPGVRGLEAPGAIARLTSGDAAGSPVRIGTPSEGAGYALRADLDDLDAIAEAEARSGAAPYPARLRMDQLSVYSGLVSTALDDLGTAFARRLGPAQWIAYRRLGITHVAIADPRSEDARAAVQGARLVHADPMRELAIYEVPRRPWAEFAERVVGVPDRSAAVDAVIDAERRGDPLVAIEGPSRAAAPGHVIAVERRPERVRVEGVAAGDGTLVVNDAWWPGWRATIDGAPAPIWRADGLVRATPWPAGRHVLELRYAPPELRSGAIVSAAGLLVALALVVTPRRRTARRTAG